MGEGGDERSPGGGEQRAVDGGGEAELNGVGEHLALLPRRRRNGKVVLVAMDGGESCYDVLRWALGTLAFHKAEAEDDSDELALLHVQQIPPVNCNLGIATHEMIETVEEQEYVKAQEIMDNAQKICGEHNLKAKIIVKTGEPKDVICETVMELAADVLVMGSHGHGMLKRALLGTTSDHCVNRAKCSVVIAKLKYSQLKPSQSSNVKT